MTLAQVLRKLDNEAWCWGSCSELHENGRKVVGTTHNLADAVQIFGALDYEAREHGRRRPFYELECILDKNDYYQFVAYPLTPAADRPRYLVELLPTVAREPASQWATPENKNKPWWLWKRC